MNAPITAPAGTALPGLAWDHGFARLGPRYYTHLHPTPLPAAHWVGRSESTARLLGLDSPAWHGDDTLQVLTGNAVPEGTEPLASVYSGHQFGVWAGQLGDGRAILLGETRNGFEIQLKGAGRTPYSRMGDGRAVLRSSIREFLCSEAMHALGVPTTRALSVTGSPASVRRETIETAAVVARVAPSFVRFGHFEHFAAQGDEDALRALADYVIDRYYPQCREVGADTPGGAYAALLAAVTERTADLLAHWQAVGFCHGVMNTDNMSILGLTIDYGPFQFLDAFDPGHICNHSDHQGRYAFNRQPQVAYWNLYCLAQALYPLIDSEPATLAALEPYKARFPAQFLLRMREKLGLLQPREDDGALLDRLLALLAQDKVDYPIFWRRLAQAVAAGDFGPVRDLFLDRKTADAWLLSYSERTIEQNQAQAADLMLNTNPKYVLRNHVAQGAIAAAQQGDFGELQVVQGLIEAPFDEHPLLAHHADFPPDWAAHIEISCSS
ncbi:protein adenylyltransferase SelO [Acidovorax lacteus]|uniref:Protein nucleotidyltransferase YdiU n=1 Tax=Acidovorax lacteus TaxID=1924988 RepID=A0ABP8L598_9BURK